MMDCTTYHFVHIPDLREINETIPHMLLVLIHVSKIFHVQGYGNKYVS